MASEYARFENVVGLELINEPKNSGSLSSFYDQAITQVRSVSPEVAALPLYIGDAWDTNYYTGFVRPARQRKQLPRHRPSPLPMLYPQDLATRVEEFRAQAQPGHLALANQLGRCWRDSSLVEGHVEPLRWISGRWRVECRSQPGFAAVPRHRRAAASCQGGVRFQRVEELRQVLRRLLLLDAQEGGCSRHRLGLLLGCRARSPPAASGPAPGTTQVGAGA